MLPKLGFSLQANYDRPIEQVITLLKEAGFFAISPKWTSESELATIATCVQKQGMIIQTLHAPPKGIPVLWQPDENLSADLLGTFLKCIDMCEQFHIPTLVVHGWQGHNYIIPEEPLYFGNFDRIVSHARTKGIAIAFENLEGEEYLAALMARYPDAGFCWDSGHDHCYPHTLDFLKEFGHRLIMTHLNDNFGLRDPAGKPATTDDLHYLPFDGALDWNACMQRLMTAKKQDILNFEIKVATRQRSDDRYAHIPPEQFFAEAGNRAQQIARLYAGSLSHSNTDKGELP